MQVKVNWKKLFNMNNWMCLRLEKLMMAFNTIFIFSFSYWHFGGELRSFCVICWFFYCFIRKAVTFIGCSYCWHFFLKFTSFLLCFFWSLIFVEYWRLEDLCTKNSFKGCTEELFNILPTSFFKSRVIASTISREFDSPTRRIRAYKRLFFYTTNSSL